MGKRSLAWAVSSQLAGVRNVTISAPGVLLQEWTPSDLQARQPLPCCWRTPNSAALLLPAMAAAPLLDHAQCHALL